MYSRSNKKFQSQSLGRLHLASQWKTDYGLDWVLTNDSHCQAPALVQVRVHGGVVAWEMVGFWLCVLRAATRLSDVHSEGTKEIISDDLRAFGLRNGSCITVLLESGPWTQ